VQGLASVGLGAVFLKFGREDELEADKLGVAYSASSGWDPEGMPGLLGTLARLDEANGSSRGVPNWALTHPPAADRVVKVQEAVAAAPKGAEARNESQFERYLDGLVVGDSREKGIVRGSQFVHPILRFSIRFPTGWDVRNSDDQVAARPDEDSGIGMVLQLVTGSGALQQLAPRSMADSGWQQLSGGRTTLNGLDAYAGIYTRAVNNQRIDAEAVHVRAGSQTYVIAGIAPTGVFESARREFRTASETFRTLSREEADRIQPNRLDFYVARQGDTWTSIARSIGRDNVKPGSLAIMNGSDPATPPRPGSRLRVVVGD
jgi:predicted Zn-dependent protease